MPLWVLYAFAVLSVALMAAAVIRKHQPGHSDEPALIDLARNYLAMQRYLEAMVVAKKGIQTHPRDCEVRLVLAEVYAAQGKITPAIEELKKQLEISPGHGAADALLHELTREA